MTAKMQKLVLSNGFRSKLGNFVVANDLLLEESLLGGTLSTSWALLDVAAKKPKLSFDGTKKLTAKRFMFWIIRQKAAATLT